MERGKEERLEFRQHSIKNEERLERGNYVLLPIIHSQSINPIIRKLVQPTIHSQVTSHHQ